MSKLNEFLNLIGVDGELYERLTSDDPPEDFTIDDAVNSYRNAQKAVYRNLLKPEIDTNQKKWIARKYAQIEDKVKSAIDFDDLGIAIDPENGGVIEALTKVGEKYAEKIAAASTDSAVHELRGKLSTVTGTLKDVSTELDRWKAKYNEDTAKLLLERDKVRTDAIVDRMFDERFDRVQWGVDESQIPVWKGILKSEIRGKYWIDPENAGLKDADGESDALNFDGNSVYSTLDQPIDYLLKKYNLIKKSHGGGDGDPPLTDDKGRRRPRTTIPSNDKMSEHAQAMLNKMTAARRGNRL